ncbi:MAG: type II toxin-antitoxin system VapC family toxin [Chthoniobacterales bacterium]|nr:type II toxin-antitoxin system VapC family toxin [Chthoniobacterales bacterium]
MSHFPDTSFLCALYRREMSSRHADTYMNKLEEGLNVSSLLLFEFRQSVRFQIRLHEKDRTKGYSREEGEKMLQDLQSDLGAGIIQSIPVDWAEVHYVAERLSKTYTIKEGFRFADILHVATALHLGVKEFLTFDLHQKKLAYAEGLKVPFGL